MCKFREIWDPFYAYGFYEAGERRRDPPRQKQPAMSGTRIWSFLKVVCGPRCFSGAESDNILHGLGFGKEGKIKASFPNDEGPLQSGIFDLCVY